MALWLVWKEIETSHYKKISDNSPSCCFVKIVSMLPSSILQPIHTPPLHKNPQKQQQPKT